MISRLSLQFYWESANTADFHFELGVFDFENVKGLRFGVERRLEASYFGVEN